VIGFIILLPLLGFLINGLLGHRLPKPAVSSIACGSVLLSFVISFYIFLQFLEAPESWRFINLTLFEWIPQIGVSFDLKMDALSVLLSLVVTGVGLLIHLYSVNYMYEDESLWRYFAYLNLFTASMLLLILANNLLLLFIGWEGVGLCSYLLIGFWYQDIANAQAGKKAFLVNRIGDFAFLLGLFLCFTTFGTLNIESLSQIHLSAYAPHILTVITLLLFIGACGKSAQIPLYVWLPDAMAGPTPVSALIHAATMVTAGVYMIARLHFLYMAAPISMTVVATVGVLTALFSASIAFFQNDIKKVLAYSTISQLGYMFLAVGCGAFTSGIFHLMTHAFFKALLFLGAGSVIHALHHEQDIQKMGGLHKKLPLTHIVFLFATLAIIGMPPFSGFFSKDEILWMAFNKNPIYWVLGVLGALMTTFYMVRLFTLTFYSDSKLEKDKHVHEAPPLMALALIVLALLSLIGGLIGFPHVFHSAIHLEHFLDGFLTPVFSSRLESHGSQMTELSLMGITTFTSIVLAIYTFIQFHKNRDWLIHLKLKYATPHKLLLNKYYIDELYDRYLVQPVRKMATFFWTIIDTKIIDGAFNGLATLSTYFGFQTVKTQTGNLQTYAFVFVAGVVAILLFIWF